jgi:hypothetical protein
MNIYRKVKPNQFGLKIAFLVLSLFMISSELFAETEIADLKNKALDGGIGLGSIIAVVASWSRNKSILWAILHGLMGWIYVIYFAITSED